MALCDEVENGLKMNWAAFLKSIASQSRTTGSMTNLSHNAFEKSSSVLCID